MYALKSLDDWLLLVAADLAGCAAITALLQQCLQTGWYLQRMTRKRCRRTAQRQQSHNIALRGLTLVPDCGTNFDAEC
jgi:hypothetical protein